MLARGFRFAGQIGTLGKVESASIRATASASAAKNEEMIVPGGCFFCYSDSFLPDFPGVANQGK